MPYTIKKDLKTGKYKIIRKTDNVVVGTSDTKKKAIVSMIHRLDADK